MLNSEDTLITVLVARAKKKKREREPGRLRVPLRSRSGAHTYYEAVVEAEMGKVLDWNHNFLRKEHATTSVQFLAWSIFDVIFRFIIDLKSHICRI
eukprot:m.133595 g.133595  ORF g.133595 m.133595 type:complete len:96 (+) comp14675_c0_seq10:54-341(+)